MTGRGLRSFLVLMAVLLAGQTNILPAFAQGAKPGRGTPVLPGGNSKEPIMIDAAKLDYFDKEQKLVYSGSVKARQGESRLNAETLTIFLSKDTPPAGKEAPAAKEAGAGAGGNGVKRMEAAGGVTVISSDQVGTGDRGVYDKENNQVTLTGNVTLSQGPNVTKGDRLVYDLTTNQARVFNGPSAARVQSIFTPGSGPEEGADKPKSKSETGKTDAKPDTSAPSKPKASATAKPAPGVPMKIIQ